MKFKFKIWFQENFDEDRRVYNVTTHYPDGEYSTSTVELALRKFAREMDSNEDDDYDVVVGFTDGHYELFNICTEHKLTMEITGGDLYEAPAKEESSE